MRFLIKNTENTKTKLYNWIMLPLQKNTWHYCRWHVYRLEFQYHVKKSVQEDKLKFKSLVMSCSLFRSQFRYSPCRSGILNNVTIVCIGVSASPQKHYTPLSCQAPPKPANCWSPLLRQFPLPIGSSWTAPQPKNRIFQWTPIIFLVKIFQYKFLVMTEKNIFVYKLFLSLNISDTNLFFMWKLHPSFPSTPF